MIGIMQREIVCALGCTEPSAVALAVAKARETLGEEPDKVLLQVSGNILKNAMSVGIPGTNLKGIETAAALGCVAGKTEYGLEVLRGIDQSHIRQAREMIEQGRLEIQLKDCEERLYIEAKCTKGNRSAEAVIERYHTNFVNVCKNDRVIYFKDKEAATEESSGIYQLTLRGIWDFIQQCSLDQLQFLDEVIEINSQIAEEGLKGDYGMSVGKHLAERGKQDKEMDFQTYVVSYVSAAADARMAGCPLPVMATTGSGNQGLTASLPVIAAARRLGCSREQMYRGLALSELVTIHVKEYIGKLSALCGCAIAASIGSACGITYLLGGQYENVEYAVKNMVADISGLICDGAKAGCALKIATSIAGAIQCAYLALEGVEAPDRDGIVCESVEDTICNLGNLGNNGMRTTDHVILDMMLAKES
ncbi:MAG: L-serine ammonia-lyase, iron-sulfur-dependent, subunit alpha [Lachnospiraceae bacterium]|nr:L-serine ammonia-lyase, iron-sulfur-dependent, subunit alpha [Lachnospiraceae bacterium]MCM1215651.1 L-serine ammonia-lyase, iron-sulfur-dependent, subunit alpha [Lachnospiraceae bacterium]MCM1343859.1 L-serine ammonia-lyase, iron-sulfur-dependent, subunit alpha [Muribaculaceae bacterium]